MLEDRSLRLERVTVADEGEYSCEADNVVGAISAMGTLTVYGKPELLRIGLIHSNEIIIIANPLVAHLITMHFFFLLFLL